MSNETIQAIYDAAKRFTEDVENLAGLRSAIEAHDAAVAAEPPAAAPAEPATLAEPAAPAEPPVTPLDAA